MKNFIYTLLLILAAAISLPTAAQSVESITAPTEISIPVGYSYQIKVVFTPSNATNKNLSWFSCEEDIASVTQAGVVTGKKVGETLIHVQLQDDEWKNAEILVKVTAKGTEPIVPDPGTDPDAKTCETPVISISGNQIVITSATPGATVNYTLEAAAVSTSATGTPNLRTALGGAGYKVTATATASGFAASAPATRTFTLSELAPLIANLGDLNADGAITIEDVARLIGKLK